MAAYDEEKAYTHHMAFNARQNLALIIVDDERISKVKQVVQ